MRAWPLVLLSFSGLLPHLPAADAHASISGTILDHEGQPLSYATVQAIPAQWWPEKNLYRPYKTATTDDRGQYRIDFLEPGSYYLFVSGSLEAHLPGPGYSFASVQASPQSPEMALRRTFFPKAASASEATLIVLGASEQKESMDLQLPLELAYRISGRLTSWTAPQGLPLSREFISATRIENGHAASWQRYDGQLNNDGTFEIPGLPPGSYVIQHMEGRVVPRPTGDGTVAEISDRNLSNIVVDAK